MSEVRATQMAASLSGALNITKAAAFDAVLSVATELKIGGTRYTAKQASEIEAIVARDAKGGALPTITRQLIGA